jgi:hypothetical protein
MNFHTVKFDFRKFQNRIMKAIPKISKKAVGIIITMICATVGLLSFSVWYAWSGIIPAVAGIGGMIVFWGLWIEKEADEEAKKEEHLSESVKLKAKWGWRILMFGIVVEIVSGSGLSVFDIVESARHDPANEPISTIRANVELFGNGTNQSHALFLGGWTADRMPIIKLFIGKSTAIASGWPVVLTCSWCEDSPVYATNSSLHVMGKAWALDFNADRLNGAVLSVIPERTPVKDAAQWDTLELDMSNLPRGCEIFGGNVKLVVNSRVFPFQSRSRQPKCRI